MVRFKIAKIVHLIGVFCVPIELARSLIFALGFFLSLRAGAESATDPCLAKNVRAARITKNSSVTFDFKYAVIRTASPGSPTVLYVPGGPGGASIGDDSIPPLIPDEYGLILTDPRGVGCNDSRKSKFSDFLDLQFGLRPTRRPKEKIKIQQM